MRKFKENKAFAEWFREWMAVISQNRPSVEHTVAENTASPDGREHFDGAHTVPSKLLCGRDVA